MKSLPPYCTRAIRAGNNVAISEPMEGIKLRIKMHAAQKKAKSIPINLRTAKLQTAVIRLSRVLIEMYLLKDWSISISNSFTSSNSLGFSYTALSFFTKLVSSNKMKMRYNNIMKVLENNSENESRRLLPIEVRSMSPMKLLRFSPILSPKRDSIWFATFSRFSW